ncbi:MAG: radical SAM family heme chaperone HemW [Butyrivibrio sp.]
MDIKKKLGIYIHIPFCISKCIYCDFLSMPVDDDCKTEYVKALCREINAFADKYRDIYEITTIFFGGGTPSVLKPELTEQIFRCIYNNFTLQKNCEITVECNPGTVDGDKLKTYRDFGVNRLSFGLQSVNDEELKALGRIHTYGDFLMSYEMAVKAGFTNINVDLMSALPGQRAESWKKNLKELVRLKPAHISAYSLIVEEGTPLYEMVQKGQIDNLPDDDSDREMYYLTNDILSESGYHRYEISNYAREGMECEHNKIYWTCKEYAGFGIGAASLIGRRRYSNTRDLAGYIADPLQDKAEVTELSVKDSMAEFMFLGLRMTEGIRPSEFKNRFGRQLFNVYGDVLNKYAAGGFLIYTEDCVRLTEKGIDVSNVIFSDFI